MTAVMPRETQRRRDDLVRRLGRADGTVGVFGEVSAGLRRLVPFDAAAWMPIDPGSGLPTGPTVIEDFPDVTSEQCSEHWRREFIDADAWMVCVSRRPLLVSRRTRARRSPSAATRSM